MRFLLLLISFLSAEVLHEGHYQDIQVSEKTMDDFTYNAYWNQIQQTQIDYLLGKDSDFSHNFLLMRNDLFNLAEYTAASLAGAAAISNIDFSNSSGGFSIGFGFGYSEPVNGFIGIAGGVGVKYNFGVVKGVDINGVAKGWTTGDHLGGGFGFTLDF